MKFTTTLFCISSLLMPIVALAQGYVIDQVKTPSDSTNVTLDEIIVTPGKALTQSEAVTGVNQIMRPVNSSQDLLTLVPGLFVAQHAGGGKAEQIFLRGFDSDHGTDFNISVDGLPVNMVSHAHGQGYADFHFVIPETIDRLNVYKGPYDARFGDFATSGTGEYFTKNSFEENKIRIETGMFDTYRAVAIVKLQNENRTLFCNEKEHAYVAGEYVFSNSFLEHDQNFSRVNLFGKYSGMWNDRQSINLTVSTFFADWDASGQIPQRAVFSGLVSRYGSINPTEGGQTKRTNVNAIVTSSLKNRSTFKNQLYYVNYFFNLYSDFTFYLDDPVNGDQINQTDDRHIIGYSGSYQRDYTAGLWDIDATAGIATRNDIAKISLKNAIARKITDTIVSGNVNQQNASAYVDLTLKRDKHLSINMGARMDYFRFLFHADQVGVASGLRHIVRISPKASIHYTVNRGVKFFIKSGMGFHSNDARAVVLNQVDNILPKAYGAEIGSEFHPFKNIMIHAALWSLHLESELVYVGDEGTNETNNPTQRIGTDLSIRYQITDQLSADIDLNWNHGRIKGLRAGYNYIPLAPPLTSMGGLTFKQKSGLNAAIRYRYLDSRPANENNSVRASGYFLSDGLVTYHYKKFEIGFSVENIFNTEWNQAQFDTESRLFGEAGAVSELHFTPGSPRYIKGIFTCNF